jgi:hypothetical protein
MQLPSPVRLLGIDLGITSDHTAVVVDGAGSSCGRRRARSTVASLAALETAAFATADPGTQLVVVVEPTKSAMDQACRVGSAQVPGWLVECLRLGLGMPAPSGQIPPPWAWGENEAPHHEGRLRLCSGRCAGSPGLPNSWFALRLVSGAASS